MTDATAAEIRPATALRGEDHDNGLHDARATVVSIAQPGLSVVRIGVRLDRSAEDPNWSAPNVAFRLHLTDAGEEISRIYTVRDTDGADGFRFDVVLHEGTSPMMRWCDALRIGDSFGLTGPRQHMGIPDAQGRRVALFLDETGIPALASLLRAWREGLRGSAWVATRDPVMFAELPRIEGLDLHRVEARDGGQVLLACAQALPDPAGHVVWAAGERREMRAIRQHFMGQGVAKTDLAITGYWGRGLSNTQIDARRKADYESVLARGGTLADYDDLAVEV